MTHFSYATQQVTSKQDVYRIIWYKGEGESKQELCSGEISLTGTEEGVAAALAFAANDIRKANPDLFIEEVETEHFMEIFEEDNQ